MPSELFANVLRCRRMARQIGKHGAALIEAALGVTRAEHDLIARLMETSHEGEFAAMNRLLGSQPGPAGEDLGEAGHIGLAITAANAERM